MTISQHYYSVKSNLLFSVIVPLALILFVVVYNPSFGYKGEWIAGWSRNASFCLPIIAAIELVVLLGSRCLLCFAVVRHNLTRKEYWVWMAAEFVIVCLFVDLFVSLYLGTNFFAVLSDIMVVGFLLNILPYSLFWLIMVVQERETNLAEARAIIAELRKNGAVGDDASMVRFCDEKGAVRLVLGCDRIISLESAGNYVKILYDDDGRLMRYSLRTTLKALEELCANHGLLRCHRSFYVNVSKIKIIRRTPDGVFAEIDHAGVDDIPVSKTYASELVKLFSGLSLFLLLLSPSVSRAQHNYTADSSAFVNAEWTADTLEGFRYRCCHFAHKELFRSNQYISVIEIPRGSGTRLVFTADTALATVAEFSDRAGALAGINGSYYNMSNGTPVCYLRIGGKELGINTPGRHDTVNRKYFQNAAIRLLPSGRPRLSLPDDERFSERCMRDSNIMTAGPLLLHWGRLVPQRLDRRFIYSRHNRTALGLKADGTVVLLVADGRSRDNADGLTIPELALVMRWAGCVDAANLDGGGSSTMFVKGAGENGILNHPSDNGRFDTAGQRRVANAILLMPRR